MSLWLLQRRIFDRGIPVREASQVRKMGIEIKKVERTNGAFVSKVCVWMLIYFLPDSAIQLERQATTL